MNHKYLQGVWFWFQPTSLSRRLLPSVELKSSTCGTLFLHLLHVLYYLLDWAVNIVKEDIITFQIPPPLSKPSSTSRFIAVYVALLLLVTLMDISQCEIFMSQLMDCCWKPPVYIFPTFISLNVQAHLNWPFHKQFPHQKKTISHFPVSLNLLENKLFYWIASFCLFGK